MKALFYDGKTAALRTDYPKPEPLPGETLVKILLSAVCNTDKEILRGYKPDFTGVMGHEFVGLAEKSDVPALVGRRVVGELNEGCGHCVYCRTGREHHCLNRRVIGLADRDGCFAEYMTIATKLLHPVPENLPTGVAVFTEPLAAALEIVEQVHLAPSKNIAVIGDGRLGFLIAQTLSLTGASVTAVGRHPNKLEAFSAFARTATEAELCAKEVPEEARTFETVVEASGSPDGILTARRLVRKKGTIILKSTYAGDARINLSSFVVDEITLKGSRCGPFEPALNLLARGLVKLPEITLFPLEDYEAAFASKAFKAGFRFEP